MYVIGLTGGIGSGKTVVSAILDEQGAQILNADLIEHQAYQPGRPAYDEIVIEFGQDVVAEDGTIDRKKLGPIVFADPSKLTRLNEITHPRIKDMMREKLADLEKQAAQVVVLEAAILFEAKWEDLTNEVWCTVVDPQTAAERASARSGIPVEQVLERIQKAQMATDDRIKRSDFIIDTSGTMDDTKERTLEAWYSLKRRLPTPWVAAVPARKLSPEEFRAGAEDALNKVFRSFNFKDEVFERDIDQRLILSLGGFWMDEEQFRAVCEAASTVGDDTLLYSMVNGGPELIPHYTWEIPLWDYEVYCDAEDEPINREHDIGIPLDRVLYSPSGKWGILLPDEFALVGGSQTFISRFKQSYTKTPGDLRAFLSGLEKAARKPTVDVKWVSPLLRHMYGDEAPPFEP